MFTYEKPVAWRNWQEWEDVYNLLYSGEKSSILQGVAKVSAWSARMQIPTAIEVTASLQKNMYEEQSVLGLSLSIIRFINGVVEPFKHIDPNSPISSIGSSLGIPDYIVTIRHTATHGRMPSFDFACMAALQALKWLEENYWMPQLSTVVRYKNELRASIIEYLTEEAEAFEFFQPNIIGSFGIEVLVEIMLNKNQNRGTLKTNFLKRVGDLIQESSKILNYFPAAVCMKLAEEMSLGNSLASIWLEYLLNRNLAPRKSIWMILNLADPNLLMKSLPDPVLKLIDKLDPSKKNWPPTSIGNMPLSSENLTLLPDDIGYAEETEYEENPTKVLDPADEIKIDEEKHESEEQNEQEDENDKEKSDNEIELW